jgi:hypothetical protein
VIKIEFGQRLSANDYSGYPSPRLMLPPADG